MGGKMSEIVGKLQIRGATLMCKATSVFLRAVKFGWNSILTLCNGFTTSKEKDLPALTMPRPFHPVVYDSLF